MAVTNLENPVVESPADQAPGPRGPKFPVANIVLAVLLVCSLAFACFYVWRSGVVHELLDQKRLAAMLRANGWKGALLCIAVQFTHVVIFVIPGEITQPVAGYVFGVWRGFLYSATGIILGSAFNFYFARFIGRPALQRVLSRKTLGKVDAAFGTARMKSALFLLFLIPGAPKDVVCYGAGLSEMNGAEFIVLCGLGRAPALFASVLLGARAAQRDYHSMALVAAVLLVAIAGFYFYERRRKRIAASELTDAKKQGCGNPQP